MKIKSTRLTISLLLAIALLWPQPIRSEPDTKDPQLIGACGVIIGITAIVVGIIVVGKLIRTCDKCLGTNKPAPNLMSPQEYYGTLILEKSTNLQDWYEIARTNASWNNQFEFEDRENPSGNAFYRTVVL